MEALQLAQMLADLNDLQAAQDQAAAKALVSTNKTLDAPNQHKPQTNHQRSATESRITSPPPSAGRLTDKYGRRIFSPPLSRTNSATPSSIPGTPRGEHADSDVDRASTLLSLYEIRAKLREQDNSSLMKAREKINALAAKQQLQQRTAAAEQRKSALGHQRERSEPSNLHHPGRT
ncbi:hypothetical protein F5B22DRAFT_409918 [Xylaria bambusicola]|uniref:uncharacterized protein n=1 Tax=Xylaria bambusicola TaxID=326684 RepID=UPI002007F022|nr:uncharacterized protein F5B22DRAFT_409918 [Xylaria bambusicola]KAI0523693.1 hypothetical protein F5B22DRAFT_409918 [Xylaria bambusicola]